MSLEQRIEELTAVVKELTAVVKELTAKMGAAPAAVTPATPAPKPAAPAAPAPKPAAPAAPAPKPKPAAPAPKPAAPAAPAPKPAAAVGEHSLDEVREKLKELATKPGGTDKMTEIIKGQNINKISEANAEQLDAIYAAAVEAMGEAESELGEESSDDPLA